jgi:hypothetical protein
VGNEPLNVIFTSDQFEVGAGFGNDQFLVFLAELEIFDALNNSLGFVTVTSNANDFADQFLALRSDTPFSVRAVLLPAAAGGEPGDLYRRLHVQCSQRPGPRAGDLRPDRRRPCGTGPYSPLQALTYVSRITPGP